MNLKVSVIIPIYNSEKFLDRCLSSILAQTYNNLEIILVDDGSIDGSSSICDKYSEIDSRVSSARNAGIEMSTGDYICFVDADDWIAVDMIQKLVEAIGDNDISMCNYYEVTKNNIQSKRILPSSSMSIREILSQNIPAFSWGKLYKSTLKDKIVFPEGISMGEDTAMLLPLLSLINGYAFVNEPLYYYFKHESSATQQLNNPLSMNSYLQGCNIAIQNTHPKYQDEVAVAIADRIVSNENWFFKFCIGDVIEFVTKNMMQYFVSNPLIKSNNKVNKILTYPQISLIPIIIYYDDFNEDNKSISKVCLDSWKNKISDAKIIALNETNCDISSAPTAIQTAYKNKNYEIVGDYFKLKSILKTGGFAFKKNLYLNIGALGAVRQEKNIFALKNRYDFQNSFYACQANSTIIQQLLDSYSDDGIYKDYSVCFSDRLRELLIQRYGFNSAGWTVHLNNNSIGVFKCDIFTYNMNNNNIAQVLDEYSLPLINTDSIIVDRAVMNYWEEDKSLFWQDREKLKKTLQIKDSQIFDATKDLERFNSVISKLKTLAADLQKNGTNNINTVNALLSEIINLQPAKLNISQSNEIENLKKEIESLKNSKSWRITAPLRKIASIFRNNKRSKK